MAQRKAISKKLRFEVFKRDSFTCQYCGKMAPDVILEVDHINPVKNGGDNNILNLITSCMDCNRGKGCKQLTDNQIIKQQQDQLKELNEKREQLKLLLKWKKELEKFDNEQVDIIENILEEGCNVSLSDFGRQTILKAIKKFGISEVIESTKISINAYYKGIPGNREKVITYIPKICYHRDIEKDNPFIKERAYIRAIIRNRIGLYNEWRVSNALNKLVIDEESATDIKRIAKTAYNWSDFWEIINENFEGVW